MGDDAAGQRVAADGVTFSDPSGSEVAQASLSTSPRQAPVS